MQDDKPHGTSSDLRKQAELRIREKFPNSEAVSNLTREDVEKLVHELQVHQIELEVQAEELRRAQTEVESLKDKYLDLYDFAPTGYVTVGANGLLIEANLTACRLLGRDRRSLINQPLSRFICRDDQDIYYLFREKSSQTQERQTCDVRLLNSDGEVFHSQLTALVMQDGEGAPDGCRISITDITERKRAEEALVGSEARLTEAERIAKSGYWEWDAQTNKVYWSLGTYRIFEVKPDGFTPDYESHLKFVLAEEREEYEKRIRHCFNTKEPFEYEMRIVTPIGQIKALIVRGYVKLDEQGNPAGMLGTCQDISERKEMEQSLENALRDLKASHVETNGYLEVSRTLLEERDFESAARTIFDACKRLTGATAGYVALLSDDGAENEVLFLDAGGRDCSVDPHLPMPIRGLRGEAYKSAQSVYDNKFANSRWMEYIPDWHVTLDNVMFAPLKIDGKVAGVIGLANKPDGFSERDKKVAAAFGEYAAISLKNSLGEEALRANESKYRTLVENSIQGLVVAQSDPVRLSFVSGPMEEITGYSPKELRAMSPNKLSALIHEEDRETFFRNVQERLAGKDVPARREYRVRHQNGKIRWVETFSTLTEYAGKPATQTAFVDVTERKALEKGLIEAQRMEAVGTLAGGIAHDFNNILQVVSGYAELLEMELAQKGMKFSEMDAIRHASKRGADLVKQILTFSRKVDTKFETINLNDDVRMAERLLYRTIPKMIGIRVDLEERLNTVRADSGQIEQILLNLAVNAKDAMPQGGRLTVTTQNIQAEDLYCSCCGTYLTGQYVLLKVSDTGNGMSEDVLKHIFEPFFTTKGPAEGTGLGLSTVFGIVKIHSGHISCESEVGKGTTFSIYFPAIQETKPEIETEQELAPILGGTETILVVDDEPLIRELAERILTNAGYSVLTAGSGTEALQVYAQHKWDIALVILDLIMPEMGGEQCLKELLKIDPQVKALIASGFAVPGDTKAFLASEAKGRVAKPFNMRDLLRSVRHVLDGA